MAAPGGARQAPLERTKPARSAVEVLSAEIAALSASRCPDRQFLLWARELAARARLLQEQHGTPDLTAPLIRRLTALSKKRQAGYIYGLGKDHQADWAALAEAARLERAHADTHQPKPTALTHKLPLGRLTAARSAPAPGSPEALRAGLKPPKRASLPPAAPLERLAKPPKKIPASAPAPAKDAPTRAAAGRSPSRPPQATERTAPEAEAPRARRLSEAAAEAALKPSPKRPSRAPQQQLPYPKLSAASREHPVVIVGGLVKQPKLRALKELGVQLEWVKTERTHQPIANLTQRIQNGHVSAVVLLHGLMKHRHSGPLVEAAQRTNTPLVYGFRAGIASIKQVFEELEARLEQPSGP